jgi:hypothetical protein
MKISRTLPPTSTGTINLTSINKKPLRWDLGNVVASFQLSSQSDGKQATFLSVTDVCCDPVRASEQENKHPYGGIEINKSTTTGDF